MKLNTNLTALSIQNKKTAANHKLAIAMERLSSGLRINSAKDDAAGLAIANRFTAQQQGSAQAARNANDGISLSLTAEGYLDEINQRLQRVRELTVQGLTGSYNERDKDQIQTEINLNFKEIDRLNELASFNGIPLLSGKAGIVSLQVGANDNNQLDIDLRPPGFDINALGLVDFTIQGNSAQQLSPVSIIRGSASNIPLYDDNTTVTYSPSDKGPVLVQGHIGNSSFGSQLIQQKENDNRLYNQSTTARHDTDTLENNVNIGQRTNYEDRLYGNSVQTITADTFQDTNGVTLNPPLPNQRLVHINNKFWIRTADNKQDGPFTYYEADIDYEVPNHSSSAKVSRIQMVDGVAHSQADLGTQNRGDDNRRLGISSLSGQGQIKAHAGTDFQLDGQSVPIDDYSLVYLGERYYLEQLTPTGYQYYNASVSVSNSGRADQTIQVVAERSRTLSTIDVETVSGNSTIHLNHANNNVQVDYVSQIGVRQSDVLRTDKYGNYEFHIEDGGDGTPYKRGTVVKDNQGNYYLKTIDRGEAELYLYYPISSTMITSNGSTHVGNNKTVITFREGAEIMRFRTPDDPLATIDRAIARVDAKRSDLGALNNRLDAIVSQQTQMSTQTSAARSRIEDADYAAEVSNMTRAQILEQASSAALAQANKSPNLILSLLT